MILLRWLLLRIPAFRSTCIVFLAVTAFIGLLLPKEFSEFAAAISLAHISSTIVFGAVPGALIALSSPFLFLLAAIFKNRESQAQPWVERYLQVLFWFSQIVIVPLLAYLIFTVLDLSGWQATFTAAFALSEYLGFLFYGSSEEKKVAIWQSVLSALCLCICIFPAVGLTTMALTFSPELGINIDMPKENRFGGYNFDSLSVMVLAAFHLMAMPIIGEYSKKRRTKQ